jgi:hypothetical protein
MTNPPEAQAIMDEFIEEFVIYIHFMQGSDVRQLTRKFKRPAASIQHIIRHVSEIYAKYQPLAKRKK